ncbi:hypothetical protein ACFOWE_17915 [Planomonospora corallina]|uniref:(2Fe-2S)-binding protein n=1 Tax=Planomonospora corallina TaxID=1806052 RepID=A0ABV8I8H6_9ACTN
MTASVYLSCPEHTNWRMCEDDLRFTVESAAEARALHALRYPGTTARKVARVVLGCEIGGCSTQVSVAAGTVTAARAAMAQHNYGWYTARRAGGRLVDGCQWHLGSCCVHHARRPSPTLDPAAILPGDPGWPGATTEPAQLDLLTLLAA